MNEQTVNHIAWDRLYELAQSTEVVRKPEWQHVQICTDCGAALITLKHLVERWRKRPTRTPLLFQPMRDLFDPSPEEHNIELVSATKLREAEKLIESCEHCNPEGAEIPFDEILDRVTQSDPIVTDYILERPAKCPYCRREVLEKTLVEPV
jgi:hypothetical protein